MDSKLVILQCTKKYIPVSVSTRNAALVVAGSVVVVVVRCF